MGFHPPYTKQALRHPANDELRIYFGDQQQVWANTRIRNSYGPAVMLPPGEDFMKYKWPVKRRDVLMIQVGGFDEDVLEPFSEHLIHEGANIVCVIYGGEKYTANIAKFIPEVSNVG